MPDSLQEALSASRPLVGTVLTLPGATAAELLAEPFDVVWVDLEHGALGPREAQEMILGAQAAGTYALVRLPADAHSAMTATLDAGADGLVLADVSDPRQVAAVASRLHYPPAGTRGWGPRRLTLRGRSAGASPELPSVWVQIESAEGVARATEIAAMPGVGALVVGTADLSFSLGVPLEADAPELLEAAGVLRRASQAAGVPYGVAGSLDSAPPALYAHASVLVHSTDGRMCAGAVDDAAARLRGMTDPDSEAQVR